MDYTNIINFEAHIGGAFGPYCSVFFDFETSVVRYEYQERYPDLVESYVSKFDRLKCIKNLQKASLLEWNRRYEDLSVLDGTQWYVKVCIEDSDLIFESSGSNCYPEQWAEFCAFISKTVHRSFK